MRENRTILSLILALMLLVGACEITLEPPETDYFITKTWRLARFVGGEIAGFDFEDSEIEKFRVTFFEDGTLELIWPKDGETYSGEWQLNSTQSTIITVIEGLELLEGERRWTIIELELRRLRLNLELADDKTGNLPLEFFLEAVPQ